MQRNINTKNWRVQSRQGFVLLSCCLTTGYFVNHAYYGRHGFEARSALIDRSNMLEFEIKSLEAVRAHLARDVALLSPELPAPDLVEEIARDVLGFSQPADTILRR